MSARRYSLRAVSSFGQVIAPVAGVLISILAVRAAGIDIWGQFVAWLVLVRLVAQLANFGTRDHLLREFAGHPPGVGTAWRRNVAARLPLLLAGPPVFALAGADPGLIIALSIWLLASFAGQSYDAPVAYRRAFGVALALDLLATGLVAAFVIFVGPALDASSLVLAFTVGALVRAAGLAVRFRDLKPGLPRIDLAELRASAPFFGLTFSGAIQSRIDLYIVAIVLDPGALGTYSVLTNLVLLTQGVAGALVAPLAGSFYRLRPTAVVLLAARLFIGGIFLTLAAAAGAYLLMLVVYRIELPPGAIAAAWLAMLPCFLYAPLVYLRFRAGQTGWVIAGAVLGIVISATATILLVPVLGISGAMAGAALAQVAIAAFHIVLVLRHQPALIVARVRLVAGASLLALGLLAAVALLVLGHAFDGLYGQDAFSYVAYATGPLKQALLGLKLPPPFFWPPGFPLLVAIVDLLFATGSYSGLLVSLVAGGSVPVAVALLGRELAVEQADGSRHALATGLLAAAVAATTGQLWQSSAVAMSDTLALAAAAFGAVAGLHYWRTPSAVWAVAAAALLALAIETRWIYGLVAVPIAILGLSALGRAARPAAHLIAAAAAALVVLAPTLLPLASAWLTGTSLPFVGAFTTYSHWSPLNAFATSFETYDGLLSYELPTGLFYVIQPVAPYWFAALGMLLVPGALTALRRATAPNVAALVAWPLLIVGYLAGAGYQNTRFPLAALPPLAVLIAIGLVSVWVWLVPRVPARQARLTRWIAVGVVGGLLLLNATLAVRFTNNFIERVSADRAAIRALIALVPGEAQLFTLGTSGALTADGRPGAIELYELDGQSVLGLVADGRPAFVLVDPAAMTSQWVGTRTGRAFEALARGPGLTPVASAGSWTLYRVAGVEGSVDAHVLRSRS